MFLFYVGLRPVLTCFSHSTRCPIYTLVLLPPPRLHTFLERPRFPYVLYASARRALVCVILSSVDIYVQVENKEKLPSFSIDVVGYFMFIRQTHERATSSISLRSCFPMLKSCYFMLKKQRFHMMFSC